MDIRKLTKTVALATLGVAISASAALAFTAKSSTALNIRSGPGTGYDIVDALYKGEQVNVKKCTSSKRWCYITHQGPDGWVAAKYLKKVGSRPSPKPTTEDPKVTFGFQFGSNGSSFTFGFSNNGDYYQKPTPKPKKARICFYEHANFGGNRACVKAGSKDNMLSGQWNDRISSIKIIGDAAVTVCKHKNYRGKCRTFDRSVSYVGNRLNDEISSFKSYRR
jgi:hypothetical protein